MKLEEIRPLAEKFADKIRPFSERCVIAGSIRREKPECKDIEVICIPGDKISPGNKVFEYLKLERAAHGPQSGFHILKGSGDSPKYVQLQAHNGPKMDLFFSTKDNWGWIFFLRTGPKEWNVRAVQRLKENGFKIENGMTWQHGRRRLMREEQDVFRHLGWHWIEPKDRK